MRTYLLLSRQNMVIMSGPSVSCNRRRYRCSIDSMARLARWLRTHRDQVKYIDLYWFGWAATVIE